MNVDRLEDLVNQDFALNCEEEPFLKKEHKPKDKKDGKNKRDRREKRQRKRNY